MTAAQWVRTPAGHDFSFPSPKAMKGKATPFLNLAHPRRTLARIEDPRFVER